MDHQQLLQTPFGINVFGSSLIRVEPDIVSLNFAVSRLQQHPREAFREVRKASQGVRHYLDQVKVGEVGTSRVHITQSFQYKNGEQKLSDMPPGSHFTFCYANWRRWKMFWQALWMLVSMKLTVLIFKPPV